MTTRNERAVTQQGSPARDLVLVTKSDSDQSIPLLALRVYVPTADAPATIKLTPIDDDGAGGLGITLTYPAGVWWEPIGAKRVWSTGSTANAVVHGVPARDTTT